MTRTDGEEIAQLKGEFKAKMEDIDRRLVNMEQGISGLHGKFDLMATNYVPMSTFEEYKKNKWLERVLIVLVTSIIGGLIAFFLREFQV